MGGFARSREQHFNLEMKKIKSQTIRQDPTLVNDICHQSTRSGWFSDESESATLSTQDEYPVVSFDWDLVLMTGYGPVLRESWVMRSFFFGPVFCFLFIKLVMILNVELFMSCCPSWIFRKWLPAVLVDSISVMFRIDASVM